MSDRCECTYRRGENFSGDCQKCQELINSRGALKRGISKTTRHHDDDDFVPDRNPRRKVGDAATEERGYDNHHAPAPKDLSSLQVKKPVAAAKTKKAVPPAPGGFKPVRKSIPVSTLKVFNVAVERIHNKEQARTAASASKDSQQKRPPVHHPKSNVTVSSGSSSSSKKSTSPSSRTTSPPKTWGRFPKGQDVSPDSAAAAAAAAPPAVPEGRDEFSLHDSPPPPPVVPKKPPAKNHVDSDKLLLPLKAPNPEPHAGAKRKVAAPPVAVPLTNSTTVSPNPPGSPLSQHDEVEGDARFYDTFNSR
jgi:hypothetical protein